MENTIRCPHCELVRINGTLCHERNCPNIQARWNGTEWIKQRRCRECGYRVDVDDPCCSAQVEYGYGEYDDDRDVV